MRKTVDADTNKVIQVKYIGDENWGNLKEKIENGPKKVRTFMVYLNVESDMDTIMDYIIDPVAGSPSRNKTVNGNVCMHVDDLIFTGTDDFLSSFAESLKKSFQIGSLDENDVMFCGQRIIKQGATVTVHQDLYMEDLHEALIPKGKDSDALVGADLTEYRSVLGKLNWLQSRTQFHISYHFSRCASAAASATIMDAKELNKVVRMVKDKPQRLLYAPINGIPRLMGFPDAAYNNADGSSQRGQCIFICQPRNKERDTKGSLIDYESHKIKRTVLSTTVAELYAFMKCYGSAQFYRGLWMDMTAQPIEVHLRTDASNLVTTAASTRLPQQKETIHMIQMLRQEACSGQMHDLAHALTQYCLADPFTKKSVSAALLIASLWALAHCMNKQRFTFCTAIGTSNLRCRPDFKNRFDEYLCVEKRVNPEEYEVVTIASCAGHSFVITREIPEGESEDIEYLTPRSYARLPLKRQGLHCYLDLVAIVDLGLKVMCSKTAQVVLVEDRVPPEALCLTWRSPSYLGCMCLPSEKDLIKPHGRDEAQVPVKKVGEVFRASPALRPRPVQEAATSSLATIAEVDPL